MAKYIFDSCFPNGFEVRDGKLYDFDGEGKDRAFLKLYKEILANFEKEGNEVLDEKTGRAIDNKLDKYHAIERYRQLGWWGLIISGENAEDGSSTDNEVGGAYSGLSLVINYLKDAKQKVRISYSEVMDALGRPIEAGDTDEEHFLLNVTLSVGNNEYGSDASLARRPGTRRRFARLLDYKDCYISAGVKRNLLDNDTCIYEAEGSEFADAIGHKDVKTSLAYFLVDIKTEKGKWLLCKFFEEYAKMRGWKIKKNLAPYANCNTEASTHLSDEEKVKELLENRRFVVFQGAPGTGKTRLAKKIATEFCNSDNNNIIFTQFHAETSYADFVSGIFPKLSNSDTAKDQADSELQFEEREGALVRAIRQAQDLQDKNKKVVLIIDEINRANLANVLGEAFYLFEPGLAENGPKVQLTRDLELSKLPDNLYVIATMNTADRSLAVVDFALRRRFAWYTMTPQSIADDVFEDGGKKFLFYNAEFTRLSELFDEYATEDELNLKPGQSYFIVEVPSDDASKPVDELKNELKPIFEDRLRYELMPLIKEYISEGMILEGADAFEKYFRDILVEGMFY